MSNFRKKKHETQHHRLIALGYAVANPTYKTSHFPTHYSLLLTHYSKKVNIFARIQPQKTFHVTIKAVAKLLGIPTKMIVRIEKWPYVLFVHRRDIGGQFISYRKLRNWHNTIAFKIKGCNKHKKLLMLWVTIILDRKKYAKQYDEAYHAFVEKTFQQQWIKILSRNNCSSGKSLVREEKKIPAL